MTQHESHTEEPGGIEESVKRFNPIPWMTGAMLLLGLSIVAGMYWGQIVEVQDLRFEGNHFVTPAQLKEQAEIPLGASPDSLNYREIIQSVEKIAYVQRAEVRVEPSGDVVISVIERQPIAMLADGDHKVYIDAEGVKLPMVLGKAVDVPILYGFPARPMQDTLNSNAFLAVRDFLLEVKRRPVSNATISEVAWTDTEGVVAMANDNGVKLIFGKQEFKARLRNWEAFYAQIIPQKGMSSMQTVDLRFQGQIVTREI